MSDKRETYISVDVETAGPIPGEYSMLTITPFECHYLYLTDYRDEHAQLFTFSKESLAGLKVNLSPYLLAGQITSLLDKQKQTASKEFNPALLFCLAGYMKTSESYRLWLKDRGGDATLHFFINIYTMKNEPVLRPFISGGDGLPIPVELVHQFSRDVRGMDVKNHPEWFQPVLRLI